MGNIKVLLHKEWLEFKQQRALLLSIVFVPLLLTLIPLVALFAIGMDTSQLGDELLQAVAAHGWKIENRAHGADTRLPSPTIRSTEPGASWSCLMSAYQLTHIHLRR